MMTETTFDAVRHGDLHYSVFTAKRHGTVRKFGVLIGIVRQLQRQHIPYLFLAMAASTSDKNTSVPE